MEPELARGPMLLRRLRDGDFLSECSATLVAYRPIGNDTWRGPEMGWIVAFVEPPMALCTMMAFRKADSVRISEGRIFFSASCMITLPAFLA